MARYTLGIYWDQVRMDACLIRTGISEFAIEKLVTTQRELNEDLSPTHPQSEDIAELLNQVDVEMDTCVASLPEKEIMYREIRRPFSDRRKIAETIGPEVETLLPILGDKIISDFVLLGKDDQGQTIIKTLCARSSSIEELINELKSAGADLEIIDAPSAALTGGLRNIFDLRTDRNYILMHMGWDETSLAVLKGGGIASIGSVPFGFGRIVSEKAKLDGVNKGVVLEQAISEGIEAGEFLKPYIMEMMISLHSMDDNLDKYTMITSGYASNIHDAPDMFMKMTGISIEVPELKDLEFSGSLEEIMQSFMAVSLSCRAFDNTDAVNFRQDDLAFTKKMQRIKGYTGAWAKAVGLLVLLWIMGLGVDVYIKNSIDNELTQKIHAGFIDAMPEGTPEVDPMTQMEQHLNKLSGQSGSVGKEGEKTPLEILRDISAGLPKKLNVVFDAITIDEDNITLSGSTDTYDNVERIKSIISGLKYVTEVKIVSATVDKTDQGVKYKLVCKK